MFKNWYTITGTGNGNRLRQYAVQIHQSPERPISRQISSLMYPEIQRRQVIMNVLHPGCARPPRWSPPVLWRRFEDGLASICVLIRSCKMPKESETTGLDDGWKRWLVGNATDLGISDKVVLTNVQDSSYSPLVHCINPLYIGLHSRIRYRLVGLIFSNCNHQRVLERKKQTKTIYNRHQNTIDMQDYQTVTCV